MRQELFGDRLRRLRERAGLSASALARAAGCGTIEVSRWEAGAKTPGLESAAALAVALGVSLGAFDGVAFPARRKKKEG